MSESAHLIHGFLKYAVSHVKGTATGRFLTSCVSLRSENSSDFLYHIFGKTWDGKTCMSSVVFDTKNVDIINRKTCLRPMNGTYNFTISGNQEALSCI